MPVDGTRWAEGLQVTAARGGYRGALSHRDFRLMLGAFGVSAIGSWAYNVALWAWVWEATGSPGWVAAASVGRFVPALVFAAYGGVLAERFERTAVMRVCDALATVTMLLLALTAAMDGPVLVVIALAALTSMSGTANDPAVAAMVPQVVGERDLAAGNALYNSVENVVVILGPALGAALLVLTTPSTAFAVNAGTFALSVLLVGRMRSRSRPSDVAADGGGVLGQMLVGVRALRESTTASVLVGFSVAATFIYGTDTVLFVVLAEERYGLGSNGVGYFLMSLGIGGVLAAGIVNRMAALPRLGAVITVGLATYCLPTALLVLVDSAGTALALQILRGAGTLVVDVLAITALQRSLPSELVSRVYGVFMTLCLAALALGALVTPVVLGLFGLDAALLVFGAGAPLLLLLTWPRLARMDSAAVSRLAELEPRIKVLEVLGIFADATRASLERLAAAVTEVEVPDGDVIVREDDPADALYILVGGDVAVSAHGESAQERPVAELHAPAFFGEIGLLEGVPRTATVKAFGTARLWRIAAEEFHLALSEAQAGPAFLETARTRHMRVRPPLRDEPQDPRTVG